MLAPHVSALAERLNQASAIKRFYPFDAEVIDWSVPIDDAQLYMPSTLSVFRNADFWDELTAAQQSFVTRYEVTQLFRNIAHGEHLLNQALLTSLWHIQQYDPSFRYLLHEVAEECQHMIMYSEWVRRNDDIRTFGMRERQLGFWGGSIGSMFVPLVPELAWMLILAFEAVGDHINHELHRADDVHPILQQIGRLHTAEEGRHLAYARSYLKSRVEELGSVRRHLLIKTSERAMEGILKTPFFLPLPYSPQLEGVVSAPQFKAARRASPSRKLMHSHCERVVRDVQELGLVRASTASRWAAAGLLS